MFWTLARGFSPGTRYVLSCKRSTVHLELGRITDRQCGELVNLVNLVNLLDTPRGATSCLTVGIEIRVRS